VPFFRFNPVRSVLKPHRVHHQWVVPVMSRRVTVRGLSLHYLEVGEGPVVLLLHGWPTSAQLWWSIVGPSAKCGRRVIALSEFFAGSSVAE